ncbi:MAG: hypothetical protein WCL10_11375 [Novosphingobium sp.]|uniref:hypothetical protein n=1 Tax=Novosphingobium sp. TaxID=1874826 RepID=UPI00301A0296
MKPSLPLATAMFALSLAALHTVAVADAASGTPAGGEIMATAQRANATDVSGEGDLGALGTK